MLFLGIIVTNAQTDTDPTGWVYVGDSKDYEGEHVVNVGLVDANGNALSFGTDDVLWLGAFIEDECRGIVEIANETTNAGVVYYFPMRVKGSSNDNDKAISFKLYKSSISEDPDNLNIPQPSEFWYELNELNGNSLTYVNGTEANFPSELFKLQFVEPTGYTFPNNLTVNVNETIDLLPLFEWEPANANVPTNAAIKWQYSQSYANFGIEDNLLLGNSQSGPNDEPQQSYFYFTIIGMNESNETEVKVFVREPITAITISDDYQEEKEVYINESYRLTNIMNNCYTLSPKTTNEEPVWSWEPEDAFTESINSDTQKKEWTPKKAGHYTLTLTGKAKNVTAEIKVWVKNRVESLKENISEIHLFVGDNLTDLIPYTYTIAPNDENTNTAIFRSFTNPEDGTEVLKENENTQVITANAVGEATLRIGAQDNQSCIIDIPVIVHPNVTEVSISNPNLAFEISEDDLDITEEFFANIKFAPDGEYKPVEGEITSRSTDVCELTYASDTKWTATAKSTGATASSSIEISHSAKRTTLNNGALITNDASISNKFLVTVTQGLINFTCTPDTIIMGRNQVRTITLKPNPETATFDPEDITVEVIVNQNFTAWELAKAEPVADDETGLQWTITPEAIGSGNIIIKYNGEEKGSNSGITIGQNFNQEIGWAWVTPYGGNIGSIEALYGDALQEMRSQTLLLFNDPVYGYFGQLKSMEQMKGYKVYTKSAMSDGNYNKGTYPYEPYKPTYFEFNPKWNWFGTPYQFDRAVNDIMTKIDFAEGDRIISKAGGFTEFNGSEWEGSLTTLKAGEGYLLYTGIEAYSSFEYPAEYELGKPASQPSNAHALNKHANVWDYNAAQFSDNMSMIADLGEEFADDRYSIGAYINGECRGEGVCVNGKWFITIHGDAASNGQAINFRVYDTMNGKTYDVDTTQPYNQMTGSLKAPISLKVAGSSTGIESISADSLNPNAKYYTIDGIEVTNPTTGLYIVVDGNKAQKVYVK